MAAFIQALSEIGVGSLLGVFLGWALERCNERDRRKREDEASLEQRKREQQALFREERRRVYARFLEAAHAMLPVYYSQGRLQREVLRITQRLQSPELTAALTTCFFELSVSAINQEVPRAARDVLNVIEKWTANYPTSDKTAAEFEEEFSEAMSAFRDVALRDLGIESEAV